MAQEQDTQHALLIPWGHFAQETGLISGIGAVKLSQKVCEHTPQAKVIEFFGWRSCQVRNICKTSAMPGTRWTKTWQ